MKQIFLTDDGTRLRAGWRLILQTILLLTFGGCLGVSLIAALAILDPAFLGSIPRMKPEYLLLSSIGELIAITTSVFLARRFLDKQSIESLGLKLRRQALIDLLTGIGITFLQMGFIYLLMSALGWLVFTGFAWQYDSWGVALKNTLLFFVLFIFTGWNEELLSRGYHLQTIASGTNLFWGVLISSAIFGVLHIFNPGATWISTIGILFAGLFLAYAYIRTKQLWLPIGLHIGWNFFEGVGFGFPVSGLDIYPLIRIQVTGPEIWTGGAFGPEAGLIVLPALIVGGVLIQLYSKHRNGDI